MSSSLLGISNGLSSSSSARAGGLELGPNERLVIMERVLGIREALLEQPDLPMRLGETGRLSVASRCALASFCAARAGSSSVSVQSSVCNSNLVRGTYTWDTDAHVRDKGSASSTGRR